MMAQRLTCSPKRAATAGMNGKFLEEREDDDTPTWIKDASLDRPTPYTEAELDLLVEGTLDGIRDTANSIYMNTTS